MFSSQRLYKQKHKTNFEGIAALGSDVRVSKIGKCSSSQVISPQCLNVFMCIYVRFLRGLGIFPCTALFALIKTTYTQFFCTIHYFSANC